MEKRDLKSGNIVVLRNGLICRLEDYTVYPLYPGNIRDIVGRRIDKNTVVFRLDNYLLNFTSAVNCAHDIIAVYENDTTYRLLWPSYVS